MKKYFLLTSILALAACGGGSGGGGGVAPVTSNEHYATPKAVRSANASVTGMETFSSSADEIVAMVQSAGIDLSSASSSDRAAAHRSGVSPEALRSAYDSSATAVQKLAMEELKNMYNIATEAAGYTPTDQQLYNAWLLADSTHNPNDYDPANLSDGDRTAIRAALTGAAAAITSRVDALVDDKTSDVWRAKTETLEGVKFRFGSEDSYLKFTLDETGKIIKAGKYDREGLGYVISEEGEFTRSGNGNAFVKNLYTWNYTISTDETAHAALVTALLNGENVPGAGDAAKSAKANEIADHIFEQFYKAVEFSSDNPDTELDDIKTGLKAKIAERVNGTSGGDTSLNGALADAIAYFYEQVDAVTSTSLNRKTSETRLITNSANLGLKYADMGSAELRMINGSEIERTFTPYVGGYDSREANIASTSTIKFKGTAIAGIDHKETHNGTETTDGMLVRDTGAELTMGGDGTAKLVMGNLVGIDADHSGAKWHKLTVETSDYTAGHPVPKVTVEQVEGRTVPADFAMQTFTDGKIVKDFTGQPWNDNNYQWSSGDQVKTINNVEYDDYATRYGAMAEFNVYGPSPDNPTEATSRFGFSEEQHWNENKDHREVAIYGAFGGGNPTPVEP